MIRSEPDRRFSGIGAHTIFLAICLGCIAARPAVAYQTATFHFAPLGSSFLAFLPPDSPLVGHQIISARIFLDVQSDPGSDAANFFTDISFPIVPFPGNENALALSGSDLGWSGAGTFHFFEETTRFNGIFVVARYGGETPGENFEGTILEGSRVEFDFASVPDNGGISTAACAGVALLAFGFSVRRGPGRTGVACAARKLGILPDSADGHLARHSRQAGSAVVRVSLES
jgi:hypothetical protein